MPSTRHVFFIKARTQSQHIVFHYKLPTPRGWNAQQREQARTAEGIKRPDPQSIADLMSILLIIMG
ncbi:hypothetical protein, partial [Acetobacter orientalis]|uniref:hypothetical protein n=1 Tax=Acetobacter orientalis TaxID=146474 RepID=UPI001C5BBB96